MSQSPPRDDGRTPAHRVVYLMLTGSWYASMVVMFLGLPVLVLAALVDGVHPAFALWGLVMAGFLVYSLRVRDRESEPGHVLAREEAPRLYDLADRARHAAGIGPITEIRLTDYPNVGVKRAFRGGILTGRPVKVLLVGLPYLRALTVPELESILIHEFAHFLGQDVDRGEHLAVLEARVTKLRRSFELENLPGWLRWISRAYRWVKWANPFYLWARLYLAAFTVATSRMRRRQEVLADALAARTCGPQVYGRALLKSAAAGRLFFKVALRLVLAGIQSGSGVPRNLFLDVRQRIRALSPDDRRRALREAREAPEPALSSHPPLAERLERIGGLWVPRRRLREERAAALVPTLESIEEARSEEVGKILLATVVVRVQKGGRPPARVHALPRAAAATAASLFPAGAVSLFPV